MKSVVVVGSINFDIMVPVERLPRAGETVKAFTVEMTCGGRGANQSVQCSLLGLPTTMVGAIGTDFQGDLALDSLLSKGVDCTYLARIDGHPTGCAPIFVDTHGENMLAYASGANVKITKKMIDAAADTIKRASIYLTQTEINLEAMIYGLQIAREGQAVTIMNPAPAIPLADEVFTLVDIITPNEVECETYTGIHCNDLPFQEWLQAVSEWFINKEVKGVCMTLGSKGSYFNNGKEGIFVKSFPIKAVDTTGAGDAFHGGFAYGLINDMSIEKCLEYGNACGALMSLSLGVQNSAATLEEVNKFISNAN